MSNETNHRAPAHKAHEPAVHAAHAPAKHAGAHAEKPKAGDTELTRLAGHWKDVSAKMKEKWSSLTDDDLRFVDKSKAALIAKIHERSGLDADTAERQLEALIGSYMLASA